MSVQGICDPRFQAVREEFERNFRERGEVGASVCAIVDGQTVVDLWGGLADRAAGRPWQRDTLGLVWSCTKGAVALCVHILVARGLIDLDLPVARYWPQFAQAGKEAITVRVLLSHQAGLPALRQPLKPGALLDWDYMVELLAAEAPFWPPGTRQGYHALAFGYLAGELVRRVSGSPLGQFFREEIATPLGLDFYLGLPEEHEGRVAPTIRPDAPAKGEPIAPFQSVGYGDPQSLQALVLKNNGGLWSGRAYESRATHAAGLPSQGGITNARGLAGMYARLALGGAPLVDEATVAQMGKVHAASAVDAVLLIPMRFSLGFVKAIDNRKGPPGARDSLLLPEEAFGHPGMGGSLGFADPRARLAFGYTMNRQGQGALLNERGQALVDAVYRSLG
ncbi:MAG TPA: serine hydrolase domain-containing protein [Gemmataceae bacterium]|nr:serine hydrolase domain-containing protein [Gemmataceae bacterium]